jgi:hypothetical protein
MDGTETTGLASATPTTTETPSAPLSTPSSTSPAERPRTWEEAYAQVDAAAATAAPATPDGDPTATDSAPASAIETPASDQPPTDPTATKEGPIPYPRHKAALENARKEAAAETEKRLTQQFKPALDVATALHGDMQSGNIEGWSQLTMEYVNHPVLGQQIRSFFGRMLGQRGTPPAAPVADAEPSLFVERDGEQYFDPAALPKWQEWNRRQIEQSLEKKYEPLTKFQQTVERAQAISTFQKQSQQTVSQRLEFWKTQPGFTEHVQAIKAKQQELFDAHHAQGMDEWTALGVAYAQVVPALLQSKQRSDLSAQATALAAGRSDNPAAVGVAPPKRPRSWDEAFAQQGLV